MSCIHPLAVSMVSLMVMASPEGVNHAPRKSLVTAIPEAIRLLKAKEYETFIKSFCSPDDLKKITSQSSLEEFAKNFGEKKAARLLEVLEMIKDSKPQMDDTGTKATFELSEKVKGGKKSITFLKIDEYWYIQN